MKSRGRRENKDEYQMSDKHHWYGKNCTQTSAFGTPHQVPHTEKVLSQGVWEQGKQGEIYAPHQTSYFHNISDTDVKCLMFGWFLYLCFLYQNTSAFDVYAHYHKLSEQDYTHPTSESPHSSQPQPTLPCSIFSPGNTQSHALEW